MSRYQSVVVNQIPILILFLLPLLVFWQQTLGGKTLLPSENLYQYEPFATYGEVVSAPQVPYNHLVSDLVLQNYQWKSFVRDQIVTGEIPLWNPHQFGGIPFLAAGQHSALYPLSVIYYVLDLPVAYGWFTVINLWLAGAFMYLFLRGMSLAKPSALLGGVVYQLAGFVLASVVFPMMIGGLVWLPLMLLMIEFILHSRPLLGRPSVIPWVVIGAIALGCNLLAGHVEITIYTLLLATYYTFVRLAWQFWQTRNWRKVLPASGWLILMIVSGIGLGLVQFIPLYEFVQTNWRADRSSYETVVGFAHPLRDVLQFIMPNFYGNPTHHQYFDVIGMQTVTELTNRAGEAISFIDWGIKNYVEGALYLGILPLILSLVAIVASIWRKYQRAIILPLLVLGVFSLTFMFGLPTYRLVYALPGINQLNSAFRWVFALTVCVSILAAFGLDYLQTLQRESRWFRRLSVGLIVSGSLFLLGLFLTRLLYPQLESIIDTVFRGMTNAENAFASPQAFYSYEFVNVLIFGLMVLLSGVVLWLRRTLATWQWLAVGLVAVDLAIASGGFNPASDPALLDFTPPSIAYLQQQDGDFRYTSLDDGNKRPIMNANMGWRYGLDDIRGYDSIISRQYVDTMRALAPQEQLDFNRIAPLYTHHDYESILDSPLLALLNVRYVLTHPDIEIPRSLQNGSGTNSTWIVAHEDEAVSIWENTQVLPRVFFVSKDVFETRWLSTPFDFVSLEIPATHTPVAVEADTGREKWLNISPQNLDSWLIVSETFAEGWRVFVHPSGTGEDQEIALPIHRVFGNFQAVDLSGLDSGTAWNLRMVYSPTSFQVGVFGTVISVLLLLFLGGAWLWRIFIGINDEESSATVRVARNTLAPIVLNLFNRGIDFVFAIVMLRILNPEEVGIYYYAVVVFVWFDIFTNFGLDVFLMRAASREKERAGHYFLNTTYLRVLLSFVGIPLLLIFLFGRQTTIAPPLNNEALIALALLYLGLFPASLSKGMTSLFYAHEQAEYPAAIATITTINKVILGVIVLLLGYGIVGLAGVSIVNNIITLGVLLYFGRRFIGRVTSWRPDVGLMGSMIRESWALMLNHFLATIFFQVDIIILEALKGARIVGQYSVSYRWLLALNIIPAFFTQALFPILSRQAQEDRDSFVRLYRFGIKLLFTLTIPLAITFTVLADVLVGILGGQQYLPDGAIALQLMIWSIPLGWMNSLTQYALIALDLQRYITRAFIVAVLFNIIVNIIFIPQYSYQAAAITTIVSEAILFFGFAWLMRSELGGIGWVDLIWRPIVAGAVMLLIVVLLSSVSSVLALLLATIAFVVIWVGLRPLDEFERQSLREMLPERMRESRLLAGVLY